MNGGGAERFGCVCVLGGGLSHRLIFTIIFGCYNNRSLTLTQPGSAYPSSIFSLEDANTDSDQFSYYSFGWLDNNESIRSQVGPFYIIDQL